MAKATRGQNPRDKFSRRFWKPSRNAAARDPKILPINTKEISQRLGTAKDEENAKKGTCSCSCSRVEPPTFIMGGILFPSLAVPNLWETFGNLSVLPFFNLWPSLIFGRPFRLLLA